MLTWNWNFNGVQRIDVMTYKVLFTFRRGKLQCCLVLIQVIRRWPSRSCCATSSTRRPGRSPPLAGAPPEWVWLLPSPLTRKLVGEPLVCLWCNVLLSRFSIFIKCVVIEEFIQRRPMCKGLILFWELNTWGFKNRLSYFYFKLTLKHTFFIHLKCSFSSILLKHS